MGPQTDPHLSLSVEMDGRRMLARSSCNNAAVLIKANGPRPMRRFPRRPPIHSQVDLRMYGVAPNLQQVDLRMACHCCRVEGRLYLLLAGQHHAMMGGPKKPSKSCSREGLQIYPPPVTMLSSISNAASHEEAGVLQLCRAPPPSGGHSPT